jgi:hypothetical protein
MHHTHAPIHSMTFAKLPSGQVEIWVYPDARVVDGHIVFQTKISVYNNIPRFEASEEDASAFVERLGRHLGITWRRRWVGGPWDGVVDSHLVTNQPGELRIEWLHHKDRRESVADLLRSAHEHMLRAAIGLPPYAYCRWAVEHLDAL